MRRLPPLMSEHPLALQITLVGVVPAAYGALTGYFLGVSESVYLVLSVVGIVGGVAAGFDHLGAKAGADAKADLPHPAILLIILTTVLAVAFASVGGWARARAERKAVTHTAPDIPGPLG
jgi:hypothetical protein